MSGGCSERADLHTFPAPDAGAAAEHELRAGFQAFRIMAPLAAQGAALQAYGLTYPRPVMDGKFFYVEYGSFFHKILFSSVMRVF